MLKKLGWLLISNFRPVLNIARFLLGNSPSSELHMPTFRSTLSVPSSQAGRCTYPHMKMGQIIPKRRHIKFRRRGITQKKAYNKLGWHNSKHYNVTHYNVTSLRDRFSNWGTRTTITTSIIVYWYAALSLNKSEYKKDNNFKNKYNISQMYLLTRASVGNITYCNSCRCQSFQFHSFYFTLWPWKWTFK